MVYTYLFPYIIAGFLTDSNTTSSSNGRLKYVLLYMYCNSYQSFITNNYIM